MNISEVAVIGSGPAGTAASIELQRAGVRAVVFEKHDVGGLLRNAGLVENYPGFPDGISGEDLARLFRRQAERIGVDIRRAEVTGLRFEEEAFRLLLGSEESCCRRVIVATGTKPKKFDVAIPSVSAQRVMYDIAPILRETGKRIIIAGSGDAAFDYALTMGKKNRVCLLNRGIVVKCLPLLRERIKHQPNIDYIEKASISGVSDDRAGIRVECLLPGGPEKIFADYLIGAIGREPDMDFLTRDIKSSMPALVKKDVLFFAGDVKNGLSRQTAIAVGDGLAVAVKIRRLLREERR